MATLSFEPHSAQTPERILATAFGFWSAKTLLSAVELGVFRELAKGPLELEALRERLGLHHRGARDFFDALVAMGMLERNGSTYSNTPEADLFLDPAKPTYVGGMLEMANSRLYPSWGSLTEALRTGLPQNELENATDQFAALYSDPGRLRTFLSAMTGITGATARVVARKFPWQDCRTFCDVGTAQGALLVEIARAHQHVSAYGFDLPVVKPIFEEYVGAFGLNGRARFHAGDFFREPLPHADVLVMAHILHDWGLQNKLMLLRKAYEALPKGGSLVVIEALIDDDRRKNAMGLLMSLNMLVETTEGFDYTGADCARWMRETGFRSVRVEHLTGPDSMVIATK
ncbi:MAG: acetylserotonin O-methyltransferase [Acidobacteria bacterium]|nr:acetylserotonin O-methyltransferase [Acidobacteriota bacterium]